MAVRRRPIRTITTPMAPTFLPTRIFRIMTVINKPGAIWVGTSNAALPLTGTMNEIPIPEGRTTTNKVKDIRAVIGVNDT